MVASASPQPVPDDARAKRNVAVLFLAQAVLGAQMPVNFVLGGLAGQMLTPIPCLATLPISLIVLGSMISAPNVSNLMGRYGRRAGFFVGAAGGALGSTLCVAALFLDSFALFLVGALCTGVYMSAQGFYRFAAADQASDSFRPKAISWVMAGGLLAAVIGPQLVKATADMLAPVPFAGAYVCVIALNVVGSLLFLALDAGRPAPRAADAPRGRTVGQLLATPRILVAMICGMVSYALMNLVMTSTPLAVVGCGFGQGDAADVVMVHVLAMFLPSFFTGHIINRFGVEKVIAAGLVILAAAGLAGLAGVQLSNFYVALFLLGIGWNFGYIGATAMLAGAHTIEERARVQGMNDFCVFGLVTLASLSSGGLMNCLGGDPQTGWAAVNMAMIPFLTLAGGALIWFALRRPEAD
ncbi:MFS transporter [uncultured Albimonas sp.]|uniref:MFS transporter n=1 Tax=uncultured Albimonas sp. TaxID=1331701 RepID=UPI0030EF5AE3|tara:strand:+ start:962 stop:2194 length:1233 start_codon:yes stop_codon:yes gene_type:complete